MDYTLYIEGKNCKNEMKWWIIKHDELMMIKLRELGRHRIDVWPPPCVIEHQYISGCSSKLCWVRFSWKMQHLKEKLPIDNISLACTVVLMAIENDSSIVVIQWLSLTSGQYPWTWFSVVISLVMMQKTEAPYRKHKWNKSSLTVYCCQSSTYMSMC